MQELFISNKKKKVLNKVEVYELIKQFQNGNKEAGDKIVEHNIAMVVTLASSFQNSPYEQEELVAVGMLGLTKAIHKFDCNKNVEFMTFASSVIRNEILMFIRKNKNFINDTSLSQSIFRPENVGKDLVFEDTIPDEKAFFEEELVHTLSTTPPPDLKDLLKNSVSYLSKKEIQVIQLRYDLENNKIRIQEKIGEILHISRSYVSILEKSALKKIRKNYEKEVLEKTILNQEEKKTDFSYILFSLSNIHYDLTFPVFAKLLELFPKWEQNLLLKLYNIDLKNATIKKHKIKTTENTLKYAEIIVDNLREMFLYYENVKKINPLTEEEALKKVLKHMIKRSLRFRFPHVTQKKLLESVKKLSEKEQNIVYLRFGHNLLTFNEFPKDGVNYYQKLSKALQHLNDILENKIHPKSLLAKYSNYSFTDLDNKMKTMPKDFQEILYLRNGLSLNEYHPFPKDKSYGYYYLLNQEAEKYLSDLLPEKISQYAEKKTIINIYTKEELNYAVPRLKRIEQHVLYLRHTKELNVTLPWNKELKGTTIVYYQKIYSSCYASIAKKLKEREEKRNSIPLLELVGNYTLEEVKNAFSKLPLEEQKILYERHGSDLLGFFPYRIFTMSNKLAYERALKHLKEILYLEKVHTSENIQQKKQEYLVQKQTLKQEKNKNIKNELFTFFYQKYKGIVKMEEIVAIINNLFQKDDTKKKEYYLEQMDKTILLKLVQTYKLNPYCENSILIYKKIVALFTSKFSEDYSYITPEKIKKIVERVFIAYTGENTFEEEILKSLKK